MFKHLKRTTDYYDDLDYDKIVDWPDGKNIAFIVQINSSHGWFKEFLIEDTYCFCYRNHAFGFTYFELNSCFEDDDDDDDDDSLTDDGTYSLGGDLISTWIWEDISQRITERVEQINKEKEIPTAQKQ